MEITRIDPNSKWSKAVIYNGIAFLCGQVASACNVGLKKQMQSALQNLDEVLEQIGSSKERLLKAVIYLQEGQSCEEMNDAWEQWLPKGYAPARICVVASAANPNYLVEIEVTAAV